MTKKKEAPEDTKDAPGDEATGLMGNAGADAGQPASAPPFSLGSGTLADDKPQVHSSQLESPDPDPGPPLPRFRVRFDLLSPIGTPEAVYEAEDEASAIAAHRRFNGLGSTIAGTITCTRVD